MNAANVKWFSAPWLWAMALILLAGGLAWAQPADEADEGDDPAGVTVEITDVAAGEPDPAQSGEPDAQYRHLLETWKKHNYRQAAALSDAFHKTNPAYKYTPAVLWMAGDSHYKLRQFDQAAQSYQALLQVAPNYKKAPDARFYLGLARFKQGDGPAARAALEELLEVTPDYPHANHARAMLKRIEPGRVLSPGGNDVTYTGKYETHPRIRAALSSLDTLRRKHLRTIHTRLGIEPHDYDFVITLRDLPPGESSLHAQTVNEISNGRLRSVVYFFTEHIAVDAYDFDKKLIHELTHCVQRERTGEAYYLLPKWLREGLALWTAEQGPGRIEKLLGIYATRPGNDPIALLTDGLDDKKHTYNDYAEDYLAIEYIETQFGTAAVRSLFADLLTGMAWPEAIQRATGQDVATFKSAAHAYAKNRLAKVIGEHQENYLAIYALYKADEKGDCLARAQAYLRKHPDSWVAMPMQYLIGKCYRDMGQYDKAIRAFNVVIEQQPHKSTLLDDAGYYRAYCTARLYQFDRARTLLDEFLRDFSYHTGYVKKARKLQADVKKAAAQHS